MKANKLLHAGRIGLLAKTCFAAGLIALASSRVHASIAYGTINNFDTVNDTSNVCYGFEIEIEDCHSSSVTYCYSYNHYGTPHISEDTLSVPGHTNCIVRYEAVYTNGVWSGYTAIPTGPIAPTLGHSFTNPGTNFGGEHFGVGYYGNPTAVKYHWLLDDGFGHLVVGPEVLVSTPVFTYYAPVPGAPGQVQAEVEPPQPEVEPVEGFGPATWVKSIKTSTHTNHVIELRNLMSDDPAYPTNKSWRNGQRGEVESEFEIVQQEFGSGGGGGGGGNKGGKNGGGGGGGAMMVISNAPENLPQGDEIITRRYEFYAYVGPTDPVGGLFFDNSVRLEPTHVGGFNQAFRSLIPESVEGLIPGAEFETAGAGFDQSLAIGTFFGVEGEWLTSDGARSTGVLTNSLVFGLPDSPSSTRQTLNFRERDLSAYAGQLLGNYFAISTRYRLSEAHLVGQFPEIPNGINGLSGLEQNNRATLQQLSLAANMNLPCGFFARSQSDWYHQDNSGYTPSLADSDFWQHNFFAGYRFPRRYAEIRLGVLNVFDRDYRLNPLNLYADLPRSRSFTASLRINF